MRVAVGEEKRSARSIIEVDMSGLLEDAFASMIGGTVRAAVQQPPPKEAYSGFGRSLVLVIWLELASETTPRNCWPLNLPHPAAGASCLIHLHIRHHAAGLR